MPVRTIDDKTSDTLVVVPGEGFWTGSSTLPHLHQLPCAAASAARRFVVADERDARQAAGEQVFVQHFEQDPRVVGDDELVVLDELVLGEPLISDVAADLR